MVRNVAIIIPSYKDAMHLAACVESLYLHTCLPWHAYIVSGETDTETEGLIRWLGDNFNRLTGRLVERRLWFTQACNEGLRLARQDGGYDWFILLNSDTEVTPGWAEIMVGQAEVLRWGIVGCKTLTADGRIDHAGAYGEGFHYGMRQPNISYFEPRRCRNWYEWVTGAVMGIHKDVLEKVGLLDEENYPHIGSDREYCRAAQRAGFKVGYSTAVVYHFTLRPDKEGHNGTKGA